jgi:hypothetical protein
MRCSSKFIFLIYGHQTFSTAFVEENILSGKIIFLLIKIRYLIWVPVAHACNPSYSGGKGQEECSSKPAWANSSPDPISRKKKKSQKRAGGVAQVVGHEFKPQYRKKKSKIFI